MVIEKKLKPSDDLNLETEGLQRRICEKDYVQFCVWQFIRVINLELWIFRSAMTVLSGTWETGQQLAATKRQFGVNQIHKIPTYPRSSRRYHRLRPQRRKDVISSKMRGLYSL